MESRSTFAEVMIKSEIYCVFDSVYIGPAASANCRLTLLLLADGLF